jgi:hypothetical protein
LTDKGIPVYSSTIAKIESEKKPRATRLGEAVGIADLFDLSVDELLGRQGPDDSTLMFALTVLCSYARDAERQIELAQNAAADIADQLESVEESFNLPGIDELHRAAGDLAGSLQAAHVKARELSSSTTVAIAQTPDSGAERDSERH